MDHNWAKAYYYWLAGTKKYEESYTNKCIAFIKSVLKYGSDHKLCSLNSLGGFKLTQQTKEPAYLTTHEVESIEKIKLDGTAALVRDLFLIQCYTGCAYTDLWHITPESIKTGAGDYLFLYYGRAKNGNKASVIIPNKCKLLFEKYDFKFRVVGNVRYNQLLKFIAYKTKINKVITSHMGRKTFGTLALEAGYTIEAVSKMMGHKDIKTTQQFYTVLLDTRLAKEKQNLNK